MPYAAFVVASKDIPVPTEFSLEFAAALKSVVDGTSITYQGIADQAARSRAFVSDQLNGKRPVDTDVIAAAADMVGISTRVLVRHVLDQMPPELRALRSLPGPNDRPSTPRPRETPRVVKKAARKDPK